MKHVVIDLTLGAHPSAKDVVPGDTIEFCAPNKVYAWFCTPDNPYETVVLLIRTRYLVISLREGHDQVKRIAMVLGTNAPFKEFVIR